jgi:hypothetical protein
MTFLVEFDTKGEGSVVGETLLPRPMQVLTASQPGSEIRSKVSVVIEVADPGSTNPAMGMSSTVRTELVGCTKAQTGELIVELILVGEESRQRRLMMAGDGVVVAQYEKLVPVGSGQRLDTRQQRGNEALLASNLLGAAITRGHVYAKDRELRLSVEDDATRPRWDADGEWFELAGDGQPRREKHPALSAFIAGQGEVAVGDETSMDQLGPGPVTGLAENDQIVTTATQPPQDSLGTALGSDRDVEGEDAQLPGDAGAARGAGWATGRARRPSCKAGGRHRVSRGDCWGRLGADFDAVANTPPKGSRWR